MIRCYAGRPLESITPEEAQQIIHVSSLYDMPMIDYYALSFALFKTYAIPSISKVLANTKEFSSKELVSKRYADTEILIGTWLNCPMSGHFDINQKSEKAEVDPRAMIALARVNWLHSHYQISNGEYLFTLSLFILEPIKWAKQFGWRELSPLECQAFFVFWKEIGKRMNIKDIPETLEDFMRFHIAYSEENMIPNTTNRDVAGYTIDELLHSVPTTFGIKALATRILICILDEPIRVSMMQPAQPKYLRLLSRGLLKASGYWHRYLCLPRFSPESVVELGPPKSPIGSLARMRPKSFRAKPWYKAESKGLGAMCDRLAVMVGYYDYLPDRQYKSEGYRLEELGPSEKENMAHEQIMKDAEDLLGCPITGPWSLKGKR